MGGLEDRLSGTGLGCLCEGARLALKDTVIKSDETRLAMRTDGPTFGVVGWMTGLSRVNCSEPPSSVPSRRSFSVKWCRVDESGRISTQQPRSRRGWNRGRSGPGRRGLQASSGWMATAKPGKRGIPGPQSRAWCRLSCSSRRLGNRPEQRRSLVVVVIGRGRGLGGR